MSLSNDLPPLGADVLPDGISARFVETATGLRMHVLEAGSPSQPLILLLHGFPELAFSWRKVMPALAAAGYHVVAPDQRGYGRTTGWDARYDGDLRPFETLHLVRDIVALVAALGRSHVDCLIGHDFGAVVAPWCALTRPDLFRRLVIMSAPFAGPPALATPRFDLQADLARLDPPRKHYQWYYSGATADGDMRNCPQGLHRFLRAYYHVKSADWPGNNPHPLAGPQATELAKLPTYYVMNTDADMAATVAPFMPPRDAIARCEWLPDTDLAVYAQEFARTGFQGGLNWYRCRTEPGHTVELELFAGKTVDVLALYIAGAKDWGTFQTPGGFEAMCTPGRVFTRFSGARLIERAGHWVQQERPEATVETIKVFLQSTA